MADKKELIKIDHYVEMVLKGRWFIIIPFCLAMIAGIYLAVTLPRVYNAETLILVQPQRVPSNYVKSLVSSDIEDRISTISQQIMSLTNLEKIINEFHLFEQDGQDKMYLEDKIESIRKRISVHITRARGGADAFSISFRDRDPQKVMRIANALATYFINENLKVREDQAIGTSVFLEDELEQKRKDLEVLEEKFKEYQKTYMGGLPEQLQTNLRILDRLQEQFDLKQGAQREMKANIALLERERSSLQNDSNYGIPLFQDMIEFDTSVENDFAQIDQLKGKLNQLLLKYTVKHPDVVQLKNSIAELETQKKESSQEKPEKTLDSSEQIENSFSNDFNMTDLNESQLLEMKNELNRIKTEIGDLKSQITIYQKRVADTPKREQELLVLKRDYENMRNSYNSISNRKLEAEIAVNMERKQKGEQFKIVDYARLPEKPVSPNMKRLFVFVIAVGLGIGIGIVFLLDFINTSFKKPEDIEALLGVPVLATVPTVWQRADRIWRRINTVMSLCAVMLSLGLMAVLGVLSFKGVDVTIAFVRRFLNL